MYLFANGKKIFKIKANNKNVTFPAQFRLGSVSNRFNNTESREVSLNQICMIFQSITILLINLTY